MHRKDVESEEARERLSAAEARLSSCEAEAAVLNANIESSIENVQRIQKDLEQQRSRVEEIRAEIRHGQDRIREIEEEKQNLSGQIQAAENVLKGCQMKLSSRETMLKQQTEQFNAATVELNSADARIRILTDMQRDYEGYSKAVRTVMREANRGTLRAIHGPVSGIKSVPSFPQSVFPGLPPWQQPLPAYPFPAGPAVPVPWR